MKKRRSEPPRRRSPERTCIVCRRKRGKSDLVRVAKPDGGLLLIDETGKGPGRGAYVCRAVTCFANAALESRLEHALRFKLDASDREVLSSWLLAAAEESERQAPELD